MTTFMLILMDVKKAAGALAVGVVSAVSAGLISGPTAATIAGIAAVVTTVTVFLLNNVAKPPAPPAG